MRGFRSSGQAQRFLNIHGRFHNLFRSGAIRWLARAHLGHPARRRAGGFDARDELGGEQPQAALDLVETETWDVEKQSQVGAAEVRQARLCSGLPVARLNRRWYPGRVDSSAFSQVSATLGTWFTWLLR